MIRLALIAILIVVVGYSAYQFVGELGQRTKARETAEAASFRAVRKVLGESALHFDQLVLDSGASEKELWFRARVDLVETTKSAFGVVHNACPESTGRLIDPNCLTLKELFVDGVAVNAATGLALAAEPLAAPTPTPIAVAPKETALDADEKAPPTPAVTEDAAPPAPTAEPPESPSHSVKLELVNARAAPSTRGDVLARLAGGTLLSLKSSQGAWGRFTVLDGPSADLQVWIAFSVLTAL